MHLTFPTIFYYIQYDHCHLGQIGHIQTLELSLRLNQTHESVTESAMDAELNLTLLLKQKPYKIIQRTVLCTG